MPNQNYDTVTEALNNLRKRGFTVDFNLEANHLVCSQGKFDVNNFVIVETYRFEGNSDPSDEAIVYAIESVNGIKGVLVNGYGISAEPMTDEMAAKLAIQRNSKDRT
jgi:hypothetical protein